MITLEVDEEKLAALEAIDRVTTPAPWRPEMNTYGSEEEEDGSRCELETNDPGVVVAENIRWPDGEFMRVSRVAVPMLVRDHRKLLAEVEALRKRAEKAEGQRDALRQAFWNYFNGVAGAITAVDHIGPCARTKGPIGTACTCGMKMLCDVGDVARRKVNEILFGEQAVRERMATNQK